MVSRPQEMPPNWCDSSTLPGDTFVLRLWRENGDRLGWIGRDSTGWCHITNGDDAIGFRYQFGMPPTAAAAAEPSGPPQIGITAGPDLAPDQLGKVGIYLVDVTTNKAVYCYLSVSNSRSVEGGPVYHYVGFYAEVDKTLWYFDETGGLFSMDYNTYLSAATPVTMGSALLADQSPGTEILTVRTQPWRQ